MSSKPRTASRLCTAIATLALAIAQLLVLGHDTGPAHAEDAACQLCLAAHGLGAGAVPADVPGLPFQAVGMDRPAPAVPPTVLPVDGPRARGPPAVSVI